MMSFGLVIAVIAQRMFKKIGTISVRKMYVTHKVNLAPGLSWEGESYEMSKDICKRCLAGRKGPGRADYYQVFGEYR
jgi:hypothetical protein